MLKRYLPVFLLVISLLSEQRSFATVGPHGGMLRPLESAEHHVVPGYFVELVEETKVDSKRPIFRVFLLNRDKQIVNMMHLGYWDVSCWQLKGRYKFEDDLSELKSREWKKHESRHAYSPFVSSFAASGVPVHRIFETSINVTIALPSKGGTGRAVFHPFRSSR